MLCALSSAQREQTLCALDPNFKKQSQDRLSFVIAEHLKTSEPGKSLEVKFVFARGPFFMYHVYIS